MSLQVGTRLGHYHVSALPGEGGMGQVWQATDTQLNRQVALKILPDAFANANDPDRLARFQREAQVLASLNLAVELRVGGLPDLAHAPFADEGSDVVMPEAVADGQGHVWAEPS